MPTRWMRGKVRPVAVITGANPVAGTRWLRWTAPVVGVETTGCACYRVKID